jgi:hypothetical protein
MLISSSLQPMWAGIAGASVNNGSGFEIAISIHDSVYNTDFSSETVTAYPNDSEKTSNAVEAHIVDTLREFSSEHLCKFLGAGITVSLLAEVHPAFFPIP